MTSSLRGVQTAPLADFEGILPSQYFDRRGRSADLVAERALMLAVLQQAVAEYCNHIGAAKGCGLHRFEAAQTWIDAEDRAWPFSFVNICDALDVDPDRLRREVKVTATTARWRRRLPHRVREVRISSAARLKAAV